MYSHIMVPVDLAHAEQLQKALQSAADLARLYHASVCYVGVTASAPSSVAHTPEEFAAKMEQFSQTQAAKHQLPNVSSATYTSHDPTADLDDTLMRAASETGADLVIMASHVPGLLEHVFASNAGYFASFSKVSVLVVR
ncbi:universal stress protein UspA [Marinobacterium aestuarii]|uniref:Universal stress protein UspA n=1 Tax=Marinobacterium aestuarii TaxID=1821621 RepID=A0A1A9EYJ2_9GAMM|nr:universal stress protein [Marinobacterium aestuarii]ANG62701.1 universal stress protein UspA [Marinobacterium aestuarii]